MLFISMPVLLILSEFCSYCCLREKELNIYNAVIDKPEAQLLVVQAQLKSTRVKTKIVVSPFLVTGICISFISNNESKSGLSQSTASLALDFFGFKVLNLNLNIKEKLSHLYANLMFYIITRPGG